MLLGVGFEWATSFGRVAPRVVDIGCGDGDFLLAAAVARPERDHVGIDLLRPVIERAAAEAERRGLSNVRFLAGDAVAWLREAEGLEEIHVYHPQPYVDPAEVRLGMLTPGFFESAWRALRPGGLLILQTDERRYGKYLLEAAQKHFETKVLDVPWPDSPRTRREQTALRKGLRVLRVEARRRDTPLNVEAPTPYFDRAGVRRRRIKRAR
jgi:tRNA (guanine-N7-)-methyltransferase